MFDTRPQGPYRSAKSTETSNLCRIINYLRTFSNFSSANLGLTGWIEIGIAVRELAGRENYTPLHSLPFLFSCICLENTRTASSLGNVSLLPPRAVLQHSNEIWKGYLSRKLIKSRLLPHYHKHSHSIKTSISQKIHFRLRIRFRVIIRGRNRVRNRAEVDLELGVEVEVT